VKRRRSQGPWKTDRSAACAKLARKSPRWQFEIGGISPIA
jgi:hypothetical protein